MVRESQPPSAGVKGSAPIVQFCEGTTQIRCAMDAVDGRHAGASSGGRIHDKELLYRGASQDDKSPIDPTDVAVASSAPAGLSGEEAGHLLAQYGENAIQERRVSMLRKFLL
jgi:Cation transporter/ATPase, N-terminus